MLGRRRFEWHREHHQPKPKDPDAALLWKRTQRATNIRGLIAGFLVIEGLVALGIGSCLMLLYWPPVHGGMMANPISFCGLGIAGASLAYIVFVALGIRLFNLLRPPGK